MERLTVSKIMNDQTVTEIMEKDILKPILDINVELSFPLSK